MLYLGAYEILIILLVLGFVTLGPVAAGLALAWVRRLRARRGAGGPSA